MEDLKPPADDGIAPATSGPDSNTGIDADTLVALLQNEEQVAMNHRNTEIAADQELAISYYNAEPFGDEEDGRSQVVTPDVAEVIDYMAISVLRTCVSGDRVVEFEAREVEHEPIADQATDAINYTFMRGQDGYRILTDWIQSGLLEKFGVIKTVVQLEKRKHRERYEVGSIDEVGALIAQLGPGSKPVALTPDDSGALLVDVETSRQVKKYIDMPIPSEEFLFSARSRDVDDMGYRAHRCRKTQSELVEMGFDPQKVADLPLSVNAISLDQRSTQRWQDEGIIPDVDVPGLRRVWLSEEYINIDLNGDGIAELVQVFRVDQTILQIEEVEEHPFVVFCPFPRAHRMVGQSLADKVMDIQRIRSTVMRQTLDGVYLANNPRTWVPEECTGDTTYDDLLSVRPGGLVRGKGRGGRPEPLYTPFDVSLGMQMLEMMVGERESRTGITRLNQGLDADALNKMLCVETDVPMASGEYRRLGDIQDGDWIIGSDGNPVNVLRAHKIHDPEHAYRITFASGDVIDAGGEHLWTVQTDNDKRYNKRQTVDTDRLFEMMQGKGRVYIPRVERPSAGFEQELPLDPYMLGTWLGDGHSYAPRITTMEPETVEYAEVWAADCGGLTIDKHQNSGAATTYYVKGLYPVLRDMKLLKRGGEGRDADMIGKHIPDIYFTASYRQRLELLRGIMDTDGCHHSNALCVFVQKGGRLLDDVVRLIESLGGWPRVRPASAQNAFQVTFSLADCPFRLSRKAAGWTAPVANATSQVIKAIDRIAVKPMRCLTVDALDGLFCVGRRFTVTHNTATGTALMQASGQQMEEYIARNFAEAMARLFMKKLRLMIATGDPLSVKVEGGYAVVDPKTWTPDLDVSIRVGLGSGRKDQRLQYRMQLLSMQQQGLMGGLIQPVHVWNNIQGIIRDCALGNPADYWEDPNSPEAQQRQAMAAQQPPAPNPKMTEAQGKLQIAAAESQQRIGTQQAAAQAQIQTMQDKMQGLLAIEQQKNAAQLVLAQQRMQAEFELDRIKEANGAKPPAEGRVTMPKPLAAMEGE